MNLVSIADIPKEVQDAPTDNLMKIYKVCLQMEKICRDGNGIGLSAVQIGIPWKLFIIKYGTMSYNLNYGEYFQYFINCRYDPLVDINQKCHQSIEGCLSLPNRKFLVDRYPKINVLGKRLVISSDLSLDDFNVDLTDPQDIYTIAFQHEIDHQLGILISDIGVEVDLVQVE